MPKNLFFLSGALFPLEGLPKGIEMVARFNPLSYGVDGLRGTLIGMSHFGLEIDIAVVVIVTFILGLAGTYLFSKIEI